MRRELAREEKDVAVAQGMGDLLHAEVALQEEVARPLGKPATQRVRIVRRRVRLHGARGQRRTRIERKRVIVASNWIDPTEGVVNREWGEEHDKFCGEQWGGPPCERPLVVLSVPWSRWSGNGLPEPQEE